MPNEREREVLTWIARGKTAWETGQILGISRRTVEWHLMSVKTKLGAANLVQAALTAYRHNKIAPSAISIGCGMTAEAAEWCVWYLKYMDIMGVPGGPC